MAILTNARDRGLPLLTKVYQAETLPIRRTFGGERFDWEELAAFAESEGDDDLAAVLRDPRGEADRRAHSLKEQFDLPVGDPEEATRERARELLRGFEKARQEVANACDLARSVMDSLGRRGVISGDDLIKLGLMSHKALLPLAYNHAPLTGQEYTPAEIRVRVESLACSVLAAQILYAIEMVVDTAIEGKHPLGICEECDAVFVRRPYSTGQIFCSRRCSHRNGQRERMRKLKD